MTEHLPEVEACVLALIRGETDFDTTAARVVAFQRRTIPGIDAFWGDAPFLRGVPTDAFRDRTFLTRGAEVVRTFRTSGTTAGRRGVCPRASLRCYDASAASHFRSVYGDPGAFRWVCLVPDVHEVADSSLGYMVDLLSRGCDRSGHVRGGTVDLEGAVARMNADRPVLLFATALGLHALLNEASPPRLHPGSLVIDTGGFKGLSVAVEPAAVRDRAAAALGIDPSRTQTEYSMTELSSQLWGSDWLEPPPWCRVTAVDPVSLQPLAPGDSGLLHFLDLASVDVPCAVQTADLGVIGPGGRVRLLGRSPGATPRGCSIATDELLNATAHRRSFT